MDHLADVPRIPIQQAAGCLIVSVQIDLNRAILERFQRELLERIRSSGVRGVILDLAGVDVLDADDFNQLRATMDMAAIMGARTVLVGLQPGIVSALVELDVETDGIHAMMDLDDAIDWLRRSAAIGRAIEDEVVALRDPDRDPDDEPRGSLPPPFEEGHGTAH